MWDDVTAVGFGQSGSGDKFAIKHRPDGVIIPGDGFHVAFAAESRAAVDAFYRAAINHGAKDNGGSGLHPEYGDAYYAAFVFDPDGYRIEAVICGAE
ncbi:MAG: glyoxalase/bleomycin resistance protein/dioxygenase family protein [Verrucomicrobiaceae bacterium]|nr:glyoxalase/bleomycin resistance protein/dioxygenase family protein [Verrucomicrobiaceae bacterium]